MIYPGLDPFRIPELSAIVFEAMCLRVDAWRAGELRPRG